MPPPLRPSHCAGAPTAPLHWRRRSLRVVPGQDGVQRFAFGIRHDGGYGGARIGEDDADPRFPLFGHGRRHVHRGHDRDAQPYCRPLKGVIAIAVRWGEKKGAVE